MKLNRSHVTVLFSGGIDSTACIHYYKNLEYKVNGLFINYGQKALFKERIAVNLISGFYNIKTNEIFVNTNLQIKNGIIQGRNVLLLSLALTNFDQKFGLISLGIHSGTQFPDCSKYFITHFQSIVDLYFNGDLIVDCPFIEFSKREIYEYCIKNKVPLENTYSCELGEIQPCGKCSTCKDLTSLYEM